MKNKRPDWLFGNGAELVEIVPERLNLDFPAMVLALNDSEDIQRAVPVDIIEVEGSDEPAFMALQTAATPWW